jgi:uncharacterized RDD family membrane protein YckC
MTDPTDPTPADPVAPMEPAPAPPPAWTPPPAAPTPQPAMAAAAPVGGTAASMVYADLPNRIIAYIIDIIVVVIINVVVGLVLAAIGLAATSGSGLNVSTNWVGSIIFALVALAINGAYFIYFWTNQRATLGMRALGLQIGTFPGGATITMDQAIRRWLALGAIFSIAQVFNPIPLLGLLLGLAALVWVIFLLYTTWKSPTKQGWHDVFAQTAIVKATRAA